GEWRGLRLFQTPQRARGGGFPHLQDPPEEAVSAAPLLDGDALHHARGAGGGGVLRRQGTSGWSEWSDALAAGVQVAPGEHRAVSDRGAQAELQLPAGAESELHDGYFPHRWMGAGEGGSASPARRPKAPADR